MILWSSAFQSVGSMILFLSFLAKTLRVSVIRFCSIVLSLYTSSSVIAEIISLKVLAILLIFVFTGWSNEAFELCLVITDSIFFNKTSLNILTCFNRYDSSRIILVLLQEAYSRCDFNVLVFLCFF